MEFKQQLDINYLPSKPITRQDLKYTKEVLIIIKKDLKDSAKK